MSTFAMAKKKRNKKQQQVATPEPPTGGKSMELACSRQSIPLRPTTSPYTSPPVAIEIGSERRTYYVPQEYLQDLDLVTSCRSWGGHIHLPDVDASTGNVLVHYLHTGLHQTLNDMEMFLVAEASIEFKRALLAYAAANKYGLFGLQQLAKHQIERFGAEMNIFDVIEAIKEDFSNLVCDNSWFFGYLGGKAKTAFEEDHTVFARDNFFDHINDVALAQVMAKCMVELYDNKVSRMLDTEGTAASRLPKGCISKAQDAPIEEAQPECCAIEEALPMILPVGAQAPKMAKTMFFLFPGA
ncbi:hypothetical protein PMIN06_012853 [Paraphaeosphaeria minitans]